MTTTSLSSLTTSNSIFKWRSLKTRLTLFILAIFLLSIWSLAFYSGYTLKHNLEHLLSDKQFSTVSIIVSDINRELEDRIKSLEMIAAKITPPMLGNAESMQTFLESQVSFPILFNYGGIALRRDGIAIAEVPNYRRIGINYSDRDYMNEVLKGKTTVSRTVMGRTSRSPFFSMLTPIRDTKGNIIGVLAGATDLGKPNFLSNITDNKYVKTGGYLLVSPKIRTIVYATDKKRIMEVLPAPGMNPLIDRFVEGFEGSGIAIGLGDGVETLYSVKRIPLSGWYVVALMPTSEAFAPVYDLQKRMLLATILLSLLVGGLTMLVLKRQLAPVFTTIKTLATVSDSDQHPQPLVITRQDEIGELIGGFNRLLDILGQREGALRESAVSLGKEQKFSQLLLDTSPAYIVAIGFDGKTIMMNKALLNVLEYTTEEINGTDYLTTFVPEEDREMLTKVFQGIIREGKTNINENRIMSKSGRTYLVEWHGQPVIHEDAGLDIFVGVGIDITARKQVEEVLRETRRQLSDIIDFLPDATLVIDREGKVLAWNQAIESMTGVRAEDMLGKGNYEYALPFYGERRPILIDLALHRDLEKEKAYTTIQRVGDVVFGESYTPALAPGNVHLSATASILRNSNGEIVGAIECIRNNTDRKSMEERLQRAEKMESLGLLAGGVAHDLNNVLGIVVGYAEMLLDEIDESSPLRDDVTKIMEGGNRSAAIVQDLLTLARRGVQTQKIVNLNTTIKDCQKTPEYGKIISFNPNVHIETDFEADLLNINGSPVHLGKTIINLVSNAVEAMSGGGTLTITTRNQSLDKPVHGYDTVNEGDFVVLSITDTGEGISDNDIKHIFEPFYTKKVMGRSGTGLGLAVVWGTIKDHNGYINVQSEVGKGTTLTLYFPVIREEVAKEETAVPLSQYIGNDESILVIDDIKEQRELAAKMLGKLNYRVKTVASGEEAVEYLKTNKSDLLLLDMIMDPGMDGLDTYKVILEIHPKQKTIIASGFSETERVKEARALGAGSYIRKPYVQEKLGLAVRKELDRK